jgi:predicted nucleic acid-binding Zn ribbon protein
MDRLSEEAAASLARNYARARFAAEIESTPPLVGPRCENCGQTVDRVTPVPEFLYLGCDDCMAEALKQIARERGVTFSSPEEFYAQLSREAVPIEASREIAAAIPIKAVA